MVYKELMETRQVIISDNLPASVSYSDYSFKSVYLSFQGPHGDPGLSGQSGYIGPTVSIA